LIRAPRRKARAAVFIRRLTQICADFLGGRPGWIFARRLSHHSRSRCSLTAWHEPPAAEPLWENPRLYPSKNLRKSALIPKSEVDRGDLTQSAGRECHSSGFAVSFDTPQPSLCHLGSASCAISSPPTSEFGLNGRRLANLSAHSISARYSARYWLTPWPLARIARAPARMKRAADFGESSAALLLPFSAIWMRRSRVEHAVPPLKLSKSLGNR